MKNKKIWGILAVITAIAGIAVTVGLFLKKAGKRLQEDLEFDDSIYFEDEMDDVDDLEALDGTDPEEGEFPDDGED